MLQAEIKEKRKAAGLTQGELGRLTGVSGSHICNIEGGKMPATENLLEKIALILDKNNPVKKDDPEEEKGRKIIWVFGLPDKR